MKTNPKQIALTVISLCAALLSTRAATFTERFNGGVFDTNLVPTVQSGYSLTAANDRLDLAVQSGVGNGYAGVSTYFRLIGDFTVTVRCGRPNLGSSTETGLTINGTNGFADVFFIGSGGGSGNSANILFPGGPGNAGLVSTVAESALFRIRRVASTLILQYDLGSGFQTIQSATHTNYSAPVTVAAFFLNEYGDTGARNAWFDNLDITASDFSSPVSPRLVASIEVAAVQVSWPSISNRLYQVEYRSTLTTNVWTQLIAPTNGTGSTMAVIESVLGQPRRFYRVVELP